MIRMKLQGMYQGRICVRRVRKGAVAITAAMLLAGCAAGGNRSDVAMELVKDEANNEAWAVLTTDPPLKIRLEIQSGPTRLLGLKELKDYPGIWRLDYYAGSAGTFNIIGFYNTVILSLSPPCVLGDQIDHLTANPGPNEPDPVWTWHGDHVIVVDLDYGTTRIPLDVNEPGACRED